MYGLHLTTQTPVGQARIIAGPAMASADFFDVHVTGRGGHGAYPHLSIDPITAAATILLGMQNLVSREVAAQETAVLTVGQFVGGTKHNIIPASAVIRGVEGTFVYTVSGSHYVRTAVKPGAESCGWVEITDGLYAGDVVVARAVDALWNVELCALKGGTPCCPVGGKAERNDD